MLLRQLQGLQTDVVTAISNGSQQQPTAAGQLDEQPCLARCSILQQLHSE
jgi:hypothetical protein